MWRHNEIPANMCATRSIYYTSAVYNLWVMKCCANGMPSNSLILWFSCVLRWFDVQKVVDGSRKIVNVRASVRISVLALVLCQNVGPTPHIQCWCVNIFLSQRISGCQVIYHCKRFVCTHKMDRSSWVWNKKQNECRKWVARDRECSAVTERRQFVRISFIFFGWYFEYYFQWD